MFARRCNLARQRQLYDAVVELGHTEGLSFAEITPAQAFAAAGLIPPSPFQQSGTSSPPEGLPSRRDSAFNPRLGSVMDALSSSAYCKPSLGGGVGGVLVASRSAPPANGMYGPHGIETAFGDVPHWLLQAAESNSNPEITGHAKQPPASLSKPSISLEQLASMPQDVYGQGIIRNITVRTCLPCYDMVSYILTGQHALGSSTCAMVVMARDRVRLFAGAFHNVVLSLFYMPYF